ncbi:MAG: glycosyltransferase family 39 protein [Bacteroidales bacterium]|nr:glycosyltransferase family 39 protein [Bacteroidales bacterium]
MSGLLRTLPLLRTPPAPTLAANRSESPVHIAAGVLILLAALANLAYLAIHCPIDLAPDEAHYWHWSRNLDLSYYSKGPLVAWIIRASCELFAGLSQSLIGTEMLAVRIPAVLFNALMLTAVYKLSWETFRRPGLALGTVVAAMTIPAVNTTGVIMTIDSPFLCFWAWACLLGQRAAFHGRMTTWIAAGIITALGVMAKYTMLLFPACIGLYLLVTPGMRHHLFRAGFWAFCVISSLGMLPVVVWNAMHDWVTFRHVSVQAGVTVGPKQSGIEWLGPLVMVAGQFGLLLGYWFVAWVGGIVAFRPTVTTNTRAVYLWWLSVPVWLLFACVSLRSKIQLNWPAPAYLTGLILAAAWVSTLISHRNFPLRRLAAACLAVSVSVCVAVSIITHYPTLIRPVLVKFAAEATPLDRTPVRKLDPTGRLAGWQNLGEAVHTVRTRILQEDGVEPVIVGMNWMVPGEVSFYCPGHPTVHSVGLALHDRHSQYDLWRPNPLADAQVYLGKTFLYVGELAPFMFDVFDSVEEPTDVVTVDNGVPVSAWRIWVCRGFRGFPQTPSRTQERGY